MSVSSELKHAYEGNSYEEALKLLFRDLEPAFSVGQASLRYGVWLLHRHSDLKPGEKMVWRHEGDCDVMRPTKEVPPRLAVERWDNNRQPLQFRDLGTDGAYEALSSPDDVDGRMWETFRSITDDKGISALGVTALPSKTYN